MMLPTKVRFMLLCLSGIMSWALTTKGQTITNSNFESWPSGCPFNVAPDGWTNFSTSLGPDQAGACAGPVASYQGNSHMNLVWYSGNGLLEGCTQDVHGFTIGSTYELGFYATNDNGLYSYGDPVLLDVFLDGIIIYTSPQIAANSPWNSYTVTFVATDSIHNIGFRVKQGNTGTSGSIGVDAVSLNNLTSIPHGTEPNNFSIYPNPVGDEFFLDFNQDQYASAKISLKNSLGATVYQHEQHLQPKIRIGAAALPQGIYFLEIEMKGETTIKKIVKL